MAQSEQTRRTRILFIAEAVTLAHVARPVVLAGSLDQDLYDVHLATDPRYNKLFPTLPPNTRPIRTIPSKQFLRALARGSPVYTAGTLREYVQEDLALIREIEPDLVVGDFRLSLAISARLANKPYMTITNAYWSPYARVRFQIPEHPLANILGVPTAQLLFKLTRPLVFALHTLPMRRVRREFGLPSNGFDLRRVYTDADHTLYADIPEVTPTHNLPANHHYLGPIPWSPSVEMPHWWADLPTDVPMVYVTLGSSGAGEMLTTVLEGLSDLNVLVIAATAGRVAPKQVPKNAKIADYLPGDEAAGRASLVICNGGSPTTYQALVAGKPVLAIPSNLDQYLNMDGVLRAGAGRLLRAGTLSAGAVRDATQDLLSAPGYTQAAETLRRCIHGYNSPRLFADLVRGILNDHPTHGATASNGESAVWAPH